MNVTDPTTDPSTTNYVIWLVRVVLPTVLFFFWYRSQPNAERTDNAYDRDELLGARRASPDDDPPEEVKNLKLMDEATLQSRGVLGEKTRAPARRDGAPTKSGKKPGGKGGGDGKGDGKGAAKGDNSTGGQAAVDSNAVAATKNEALLVGEERMHVESMLNFVAFSHKERPQRVFLAVAAHPPPPPKRLPPKSVAPADANTSGAAKANAEAQMVLKGLVNPKIGLTKCAGIAKALHKQLEDSQVVADHTTFALMVETCVNARDLKAASEFLMKMETSGYCPNSELLDKVMDLYSESRADAKTPGKDASWWNDEADKIGDKSDETPIMRGSASGASGGAAPFASIPSGGSLTASRDTGVSLRPGGSMGGGLTGGGASSAATKKAAPWAAKNRSPAASASSLEKPARESWDDMLMDEFEFDH